MERDITEGGAIQRSARRAGPYGPISAEDVVIRLASDVRRSGNEAGDIYRETPLLRAMMTGNVLFVGEKTASPEAPDYGHFPEMRPWLITFLGSRLGFGVFEFLARRTPDGVLEDVDDFLEGMKEAVRVNRGFRQGLEGITRYEGHRLSDRSVLITKS